MKWILVMTAMSWGTPGQHETIAEFKQKELCQKVADDLQAKDMSRGVVKQSEYVCKENT